MSQEKPESIDRHKRAKMAQKFHTLQTYPIMQAEVIANHYAKLAGLSMEILKMVKHRNHAGGTLEINRCIARLIEEIQVHHREDFGIELSWEEPEFHADGT